MTTAPPLTGIKVVEFAGLAPGPFCGLFLADWGASVTRIDRTGQNVSADFLARGKRSIALNLKTRDGIHLAKKLISQADVLIDPFRPGVLEKLGLGPDVFLGKDGMNRRLIYTRIVGFSRRGYHKDMAGHDLNYLAVSGVLAMMTPSNPEGRPLFPLNILGDFAGGGHMAATGVLLALLERSKSGLGQIVESDMVSGIRYVSSFPMIHDALSSPLFANMAGFNILDGGAPYYNVYRCKDGRWITIAAIEPEFYAKFLALFIPALSPGFYVPGLKNGMGWVPTLQKQTDRVEWDDLRLYLQAGFLTKTANEWAKIFDGQDACVVPVLTPEEAAAHTTTSSRIPHPHPDLSRTPALGSIPGQNSKQSLNIPPGTHTEEVLGELGITKGELLKWVKERVIEGVSKASL